MRKNPLFTRNSFQKSGYYEIPLVKKQEIDLTNLKFITYADTKYKDTKNKDCGVIFFIDDWRFYKIFDNPQKTLAKLSQYSVLCTPEYSLYADLPIWRQIEHVAKNRWCGAYWQEHGLKVIPTISWSLSQSFEFCFDGIEQKSIVAISTIGCRKLRINFMRGYDKMLEKINPQAIICYGKIFSEMDGNIIEVPYFRNMKEVA